MWDFFSSTHKHSNTHRCRRTRAFFFGWPERPITLRGARGVYLGPRARGLRPCALHSCVVALIRKGWVPERPLPPPPGLGSPANPLSPQHAHTHTHTNRKNSCNFVIKSSLSLLWMWNCWKAKICQVWLAHTHAEKGWHEKDTHTHTRCENLSEVLME